MAAINGTNPRCRLPWNPILGERRCGTGLRVGKGRLMPSSVVLTLRKTAKGQAAERGGGAEVGQPPMYQLAEGRIGTIGQTVSRTINGAGTTVPWIWSVTKFDA